MAIALPGACNMFVHLQNAILPLSKTWVDLRKGFHQAFRWIAEDIATQPMRLAELIPIGPSTEGHHDASGKGAGCIWFPGDAIDPRTGWSQDIPMV